MRIGHLPYNSEPGWTVRRAMRSAWSALNTRLRITPRHAILALLRLLLLVLGTSSWLTPLRGKARLDRISDLPRRLVTRRTDLPCVSVSRQFQASFSQTEKRQNFGNANPKLSHVFGVTQNDFAGSKHRIPPVIGALSQGRKAGSDHIRGLPRHLFTRWVCT